METFKTFPATKADALTLLYLQNQDLSDKTIEEIVALYDNIEKSLFHCLSKIARITPVIPISVIFNISILLFIMKTYPLLN